MVVDRNNLITPEGYGRLVEEYNFLVNTERPRIVEEVSFAAKQGDRSENAEYLYGKKRLREIDSRLRFLSGRIERARIINPSEQKGDCILFGATVTLENEEGQSSTYQIVGEDEIDLTKGQISWKSPVGNALLKAKQGETVEVTTPRGPVCYTIVSFVFK